MLQLTIEDDKLIRNEVGDGWIFVAKWGSSAGDVRQPFF
jgi:hypothetical protein